MPGRRTTVTVPAAAELDRRAEMEARARLVRSIGGSVGGPFPTDDEAAAAARVLREE
jgi:hypothetical protein